MVDNAVKLWQRADMHINLGCCMAALENMHVCVICPPSKFNGCKNIGMNGDGWEAERRMRDWVNVKRFYQTILFNNIFSPHASSSLLPYFSLPLWVPVAPKLLHNGHQARQHPPTWEEALQVLVTVSLGRGEVINPWSNRKIHERLQCHIVKWTEISFVHPYQGCQRRCVVHNGRV